MQELNDAKSISEAFVAVMIRHDKSLTQNFGSGDRQFGGSEYTWQN